MSLGKSCFSFMMLEGPKPSISPDNLLVGDIIYFMDSSKQAIHVAVYTGKKEDTHFITHSVSAPYNSVMTTRLKADVYPYKVYRCTDFNLAMQVTCRMLSWVNHGLNFSHAKSDGIYSNFIDAYPNCHPVEGGRNQLEHAKKDFDIIFYRYISMASHPNQPFMVNDIQNEGARCSEAIVMAYNIETLLCADAVHSIDKLNVHWVTDKTTVSPEIIADKFSPHSNYWAYFQRANNPDEYQPHGKLPENGIKDGHYPCSLSAWNYEQYPSIEVFVQQYPFLLPLDSKIVSSWALMTYMQNTPGLWQDMGELMVPEICYPLAELEAEERKKEWKDYVVQLFQKRDLFQNYFKENLEKAEQLEKFQYSPTKRNASILVKKTRPLSVDLGEFLQDSSMDMIGSEEANIFSASTQAIIFGRANKYTSPEKKVVASSKVTLQGTPSCRKLFF